MNNLVKKETKPLTGTVKMQYELANELNVASEEMNAAFTPYGKKCIVNAIAGLATTCNQNGIDFKSVNPTLLKLALQNVGYTELNYAAIPSEIYFDLRKVTKTDEDGKSSTVYNITIKPQGAGNEKLTRTYGVGLKKEVGLKMPWLIRDGDDFTYPSFNGLEVTPPKWTPKSYDKKIIMVVYPAEKVDGSVEYLIATREGVKANIVAQIRQNTLYEFKKEYTNKKGEKYEKVDTEARDAFYERLNAFAESHTMEELLKEPEFAKYVNPTYTSGGSKEQMILRKMKNNALKNYPKEYDNAYIRNAVENMFEDKDESLDIKKENAVEVDVVEKVEKEIEAKPTGEQVPDFDVDENGVVSEQQPEAAQEEIPEPKDDEDYGF